MYRGKSGALASSCQVGRFQPDNCHLRVSFATNHERTAKLVSDALGTATEMKAMIAKLEKLAAKFGE
jgi:hypothetical protein